MGDSTIRIRLSAWVALAWVLLAASMAHGAQWPTDWDRVAGSPAELERVRAMISREQIMGGYADMTPLALTLTEASRAQSGPLARAELADLAAVAAPGDARVRFWNMRVSALSSGDYGKAVTEGLAALGALLRDPWVQVLFTVRLALVLSLGGLVAGLAVLLAGLPRVAALANHDVCDLFPKKLRRYTPHAFLLICFCAALFLGLGPLLFLPLLLFLMMIYLPKRVRVAMGVSFAAALLIFPALSLLDHLGGESGARAWTVYRVLKGDGGEALEREVEALFDQEGATGLMVRARLARRRGDLQRAGGLLDKAARAGGDGGVIAFERGNVFFLNGDMERALAAYDEALEYRPGDWLIWFNKNLAHLGRLELDKAEHALQSARGIDEGAVESHQIATSDFEAGLLPSSAQLPASWVRDELIYATLEQGAAEPFWQAVGARYPQVRPVYVAALMLLMTLLSLAVKPGRLSRPCPSCGTVICTRCERAAKDMQLCLGCVALKRQTGVDATGRERMRNAVERHARRSRRALRSGSMLLPGWNQFVHRGGIVAPLVGVLWAASLATVACQLILPLPVLYWTAAGMPWIGLGVIVLVWLGACRSAR